MTAHLRKEGRVKIQKLPWIFQILKFVDCAQLQINLPTITGTPAKNIPAANSKAEAITIRLYPVRMTSVLSFENKPILSDAGPNNGSNSAGASCNAKRNE
jgi:hypothetical protein